jgi:hypothetical protein
LDAASAGVVTLDAVAKTITSDVKTVEFKQVFVEEGQVGAYIQSTLTDPQAVTIKVTGLKDEKYDVYVNGGYVGQKTGPEMAKGMELSIKGRVADPDMMRCLNIIRKTLPPAWEHLVNNKEPAPQRTFNLLDQALDMGRAGLNADRAYRSVDVVIAPAGKMLRQMVWLTRYDAEGTVETVARSLGLIQRVRDRIYRVIADPAIRDPAIAALTPVDLTASYADKGGKPVVEAAVTNNCDLPLNGSLTAELPKGWKMGAKAADIKDLKPGKTARFSLPLTRPGSGGNLAADVPVAASLTVSQGRYMAKWDLKAVAKLGGSAGPEPKAQ